MPSDKDLLNAQYQNFTEAIGVPSEFLSVFRKLISFEELPILYFLTGEFLTISKIKEKLNIKESIKLPSIIDKLFKKGFLKEKTINDETTYKCQSFYEIIKNHLQAYYSSILEPGELNALRHYYINTRIAETEDAITKGQLKFSSKVIPIDEAFTLSQQILPMNQAIQILEKARTICLADCGCRVTFENCNNPIETCLILNEEGEYLISRGYGKSISLNKAKKVLEIANQASLVHLSMFLPGRGDYSICSCCSCCCHELQALLKFNKSSFIAKTDYIAILNPDECNSCQTCIKRCLFGARELDNEVPMIIEEKCYGCGLCITSCPTQATQLVLRTSNR